MESSTIAPTETSVSPVTFHSEASNYRVVIKPARRRQIGESNESEIIPGKDIQFYDGVFVAHTQEEIDFLRGYGSYGEYYWEVGSAEDRPENSAATQKLIIEKAMAGDLDSVADILVAERSALSRPEVIAACEAALSAGGGELPAKPDTPLHELQRVRMGPAAGTTPGVSPDPVPETPLVDPSTLTPPPVGSEPAAPAPPVAAAGTVPTSETPVQEPVPEAPAAEPGTGQPVVEEGQSEDAAGEPGAPAAE